MKVRSRQSFINPFGGFLNKTSFADMHVKLYEDKYNIMIIIILNPRKLFSGNICALITIHGMRGRGAHF